MGPNPSTSNRLGPPRTHRRVLSRSFPGAFVVVLFEGEREPIRLYDPRTHRRVRPGGGCPKDGKWHYYRMTEAEADPSVRRALEWVLAELPRDPSLRGDVRRIREVRRKDLEELCACYRG